MSFDIDPKGSALEEGLKRLGQGVQNPLFASETVEIELKAMMNENGSLSSNLSGPLLEARHALTNPEHPLCTMYRKADPDAIRKAAARAGVAVNEWLKTFYHEHCSANRMALVVLGRQPIDDLKRYVEENFSALPNLDLPGPNWKDKDSFVSDAFGKQIFYKSPSEGMSLIMNFPFFYREDWRSKPSAYLEYILNHEGPDSLYSRLKEKDWIVSNAFYEQAAPRYMSMFTAVLRLTDEGGRCWEDVAAAVFQQIFAMTNDEPNEVTYNDYKAMRQINFDWLEPARENERTERIAHHMLDDDYGKDLLQEPTIVPKWDVPAIREALRYLTPEKVMLIVADRNAPDAAFPKGWNLGKTWYGGEYGSKAMSDALMEKLRTAYKTGKGPLDDVKLPQKNEFIPEDFTIVGTKAEKRGRNPKQIRLSQQTLLWHKEDDWHLVPKLKAQLYLWTPTLDTAERCMAGAVLGRLITLYMAEQTYDARFAESKYEISAGRNGVVITFYGFHHKLHLLMTTILGAIKSIAHMSAVYTTAKDTTHRGLQSQKNNPPWTAAQRHLSWLLFPNAFLLDEEIRALGKLTFEQVVEAHSQLLSEFNIEMFVHGNVNEAAARALAENVQTTLSKLQWSGEKWELHPSNRLSSGDHWVWHQEASSPLHQVNIVGQAMYVGHGFDNHLRPCGKLLERIFDEPLETELKHNQGYHFFHFYESSSGQYTAILV